ncbi:MAG: L-lysine 6-transaminase [Sorangiineae bacterium]|nr:L-lysine 6-transaminase [Polyangiaceae bacterium]MEB2324913.1 L-lysine 6-transaminase [Sorangiineae bacterium]
MFRRSEVAASAVHDTLRKHLLVDGYPIVVDTDRSSGSHVRDLVTGRDYLDFFSFFASNPLGFNHPGVTDREFLERLAHVSVTKVSNSDYYTTYMAEFVDTLSRSAAPAALPHYFFVDGGALAVENAMKVAFDWKVQKNLAAGNGEKGQQILHLRDAFHGRSGYTLSVTNSDPVKTRWFPKFDWPRIDNPAIVFPLEGEHLARVAAAEAEALRQAERHFDERPDDIAAILVEPIQGEGGDNHFRPEFLARLRRLADEREALLIFDEVQTGLGLTGSWWAFEQLGVTPDIVCFAKKMQVGGIFVGARVDEIETNVFKVPSRINSTWGASLVDMVRATRILEIIENERLLDNARARGEELLAGLAELARRRPAVTNSRGRGLMCAIDLPTTEARDRVVRECFDDGMIVLKCGARSVRFRPTLTVTAEAIAEGVERLDRAIASVLG